MTVTALVSSVGAEAVLAAEAVAPADGVFALTWLLVAFPLLGAAVLLLSGRRGDAWGHVLGTAMPLASFVVAAVLYFALLGRGDEERAVSQQLWQFVEVGDYQVQVGLLLDQLSMAFVLLITGVGTLIHVYSIGYMEHDEHRRRFFGYLNLFVASMLLLVLADDYLILYVGWEGVGLASYLLIGFWQHKPSAAVAAKKAFVANRVGDLGMSLAIMSMFVVFGTTAFVGVLGSAEGAPEGWLVAIGLLLLLGACGKSAQFPLQTWLLDAMEGPTPVSALIHAATMVTAGVYLIVRSGVIFEGAPVAATAVVLVGTITLIIGAVIGCAKDDIKKVLAGSTMSQIGYMVLAAGLGPAGYVFAIFHLLTHGFFKANMFLGAGSVMHGMQDRVEMRTYGGLRAIMPITFWTFAAGYLAIIGIPPFAGFWSKDLIIEAAFGRNWVIGLCALLGAGVTAFYMTRLFVMTFLSDRRWAADDHPHESPWIMTVPLIVLGALSVVGGVLLEFGLPGLPGIEPWLEPVTGFEESPHPIPPLALQLITLVVVVIGVTIGWRLFGRRPVPTAAPRGNVITVAARNDLFADAANEALLMRPGQYLTRSLVYADNRGIDGAVLGTAAAVGGLSSRWRRWQTGFVRSYALSMLAGALLVVVAMLLVRLP